MNACVLQPNASHTEPHSSSIIYVVNSAEHPFDIEKASVKCASTVISIPIADWSNALTPWPAPGFYENEPWFGGHGRETLEELTRRVIPAIEARLGAASGIENPRLSHLRKESDSIKRAICGYSLGGLFALYAFANDTRFDACASISGSLWYQGWMNYLNEKTERIAPSTPVAADRFDGQGATLSSPSARRNVNRVCPCFAASKTTCTRAPTSSAPPVAKSIPRSAPATTCSTFPNASRPRLPHWTNSSHACNPSTHHCCGTRGLYAALGGASLGRCAVRSMHATRNRSPLAARPPLKPSRSCSTMT